MNFIKRLWKGEIKLVVTFWVFAIVVPFLYYQIKIFAPGFISFSFSNFFLYFLLLVIEWLYFIFIVVCLLHSARRYQGPKFFAWMARLWPITVLAAPMLTFFLLFFDFTDPAVYIKKYVVNPIPAGIKVIQGKHWAGFKAPTTVIFAYKGDLDDYGFLHVWRKIDNWRERMQGTSSKYAHTLEEQREGSLRTLLDWGLEIAESRNIKTKSVYQADLGMQERVGSVTDFKYLFIDSEQKKGLFFIPGD